MTNLKYIAVEGVIGAGKTSLVRKLQEKLNATVIFEQHDENPFLEKFYEDRSRYAFQTQMFFLINRYKQLESLNEDNLFTDFILSDYIFEKDRIFAYQNLDRDELKVYDDIFPSLAKNLRKPDLVVYLQSNISRLMANIKIRNRYYESNMDLDYIRSLQESYMRYFYNYKTTPLLIVDSTEIDFIKHQDDFDNLFDAIFREDRGNIEFYKPESRNLL